MRNKLERSIHACFSKIKIPSTTTKKLTPGSSPLPHQERHRTPPPPPPPFSPEDLSRPLPTATNLVKNFNSLYDDDDDDLTSDDYSSASSLAPDLSAAFASQRFFSSSPGLSNSIVESASSSSSFSSLTNTNSARSGKIAAGCGVAVPTYSRDPFVDFRRSMQEMVEARRLVDVGADWDHLHELLTCYLSLNPKSAHKFIVRAFSDLLVSMMGPPPPPTMKNAGSRGSAGKRRLL